MVPLAAEKLKKWSGAVQPGESKRDPGYERARKWLPCQFWTCKVGIWKVSVPVWDLRSWYLELTCGPQPLLEGPRKILKYMFRLARFRLAFLLCTSFCICSALLARPQTRTHLRNPVVQYVVYVVFCTAFTEHRAMCSISTCGRSDPVRHQAAPGSDLKRFMSIFAPPKNPKFLTVSQAT